MAEGAELLRGESLAERVRAQRLEVEAGGGEVHAERRVVRRAHDHIEGGLHAGALEDEAEQRRVVDAPLVPGEPRAHLVTAVHLVEALLAREVADALPAQVAAVEEARAIAEPMEDARRGRRHPRAHDRQIVHVEARRRQTGHQRAQALDRAASRGDERARLDPLARERRQAVGQMQRGELRLHRPRVVALHHDDEDVLRAGLDSTRCAAFEAGVDVRGVAPLREQRAGRRSHVAVGEERADSGGRLERQVVLDRGVQREERIRHELVEQHVAGRGDVLLLQRTTADGAAQSEAHQTTTEQQREPRDRPRSSQSGNVDAAAAPRVSRVRPQVAPSEPARRERGRTRRDRSSRSSWGSRPGRRRESEDPVVELVVVLREVRGVRHERERTQAKTAGVSARQMCRASGPAERRRDQRRQQRQQRGGTSRPTRRSGAPLAEAARTKPPIPATEESLARNHQIRNARNAESETTSASQRTAFAARSRQGDLRAVAPTRPGSSDPEEGEIEDEVDSARDPGWSSIAITLSPSTSRSARDQNLDRPASPAAVAAAVAA